VLARALPPAIRRKTVSCISESDKAKDKMKQSNIYRLGREKLELLRQPMAAQGMQIGTRFADTIESSAHDQYKQKIVASADNGTVLAFRKDGLVRMLKNDFALQALNAEAEGWDAARLQPLLGRKREQLGIFQGNETEGEMEAGQSSGMVREILTVAEVFEKLISEYDRAMLDALK